MTLRERIMRLFGWGAKPTPGPDYEYFNAQEEAVDPNRDYGWIYRDEQGRRIVS